jgi:hypothetical protein
MRIRSITTFRILFLLLDYICFGMFIFVYLRYIFIWQFIEMGIYIGSCHRFGKDGDSNNWKR